MPINPTTIKEMRQKTGAGIMAIKEALKESKGDTEKAATILRQKGEAVAAKKSDREAAQGVVEAYIHNNHKVGSILELNCETDFVARNPEFRKLARDIVMHITAMNPKIQRI